MKKEIQKAQNEIVKLIDKTDYEVVRSESNQYGTGYDNHPVEGEINLTIKVPIQNYNQSNRFRVR